jgi:XTP/dITP diphosphohydrolase
MVQIVIATNNVHKVGEIKHLISDRYLIKSLQEVNILEELPETHETLEENAIEKASYVYNKYKFNCFADDTGLEIEALDGKPGVYSARYAGIGCSYEDNVNKILDELRFSENRNALFRTVIAYIENGKINTFEGKVEGEITWNKSGTQGFGYDPVFRPKGFEQTFAEMSLETKNRISHRARALESFIRYLKTMNL